MNFNRLLLAFSIILLMISCKNEIELQGILINVKLNPSFITLNENTDVPMNVKGNKVKSLVDTNQIIYAIQIYENDSAYYYGLFDNVDSMKLAVRTGKNYRFKIATYKAGTGSGLKLDVLNNIKYFYLPNKILLGNKFIKGNVLNNINLISSIKLNTSTNKDYPEIDVFYCEKTVVVEKGLVNIDFNLLRMGFGVTYNVDRLKNGKLFISMGNDTTTLTSLDSTASSIRLFNVIDNNFSTVFKNANSYSDSILIKVQWISSTGTTLNTQAKYKFTRNYMKTINIQLNTTNLNIGFEDWKTETVTDVDGNIYKIVTIGTQTWMAENLKTTKLNDGTLIPQVKDQTQWANLSSAGFCFYNNDETTYKSKFGALYNWYAVGTNKLAPIGWHVPTDEEWTILTTFLGGVDVAGGKLKEVGIDFWLSPNTGANNATNFSALPEGSRGNNNGTFLEFGKVAFWWTSTDIDGYSSYFRSIGYGGAGVGRSASQRINGLAVRCIKD